MSTLSLRLPDSLHKAAKMLAEKERVSVNQLIALAIAEKISALETKDYLEKRAHRGNRNKFLNVLKQVPDVDPDEADKM